MTHETKAAARVVPGDGGKNIGQGTDLAIIPAALTSLPRWVAWRGAKVPLGRNGLPADSTDPANWSSYDDARARAPQNGGVGIVLGDLEDGRRLGGVDLDACRDPETGVLTEWAREIVANFGSYAEISPSGTGVKIFALGAPQELPGHVLPMPGEPINGKRPQVEAYMGSRYFTVTGQRLPEAPAEVRVVGQPWLDMIARLKAVVPEGGGERRPAAGRNDALYRRLCGLRAKGWSEDAIRAAAEAENRNPDSELHANFAEGSLDARELDEILKRVMRHPAGKAIAGEFETNSKGIPYANHQGNIRIALDKLGVAVSHDVFADRLLSRRGGDAPAVLDDQTLARLWLEIDETFKFRPTESFFRTVVVDHAHAGAFHPVRDYLAGLTWDETPRLDRWLVEYGGAADSEYCRAVGALMLIAAVRRVRRPGVKFDEMPVLESPQGTNKSSALAALCPDSSWFTDDLPLDVTSKEVIERTNGRWIVEAAELSGLRKGDIEHLKAFLSRQVDVARLAYGRTTTERPRHFIVVGTTNSDAYLKDATGNRRFWPLRVAGFDLDRLRADRDQLWAEAARREAAGESIRLDPALWPHAEVQQERRRVEDPWETTLADTLGDLNGKILVEDVWRIVGMNDRSRRTQADNARLGEAIRRVGFTRDKRRHEGKVAWHYVRGTKEETERRIVLDFERDDEGRVIGAPAARLDEAVMAPF